jgi:hypothetical protein
MTIAKAHPPRVSPSSLCSQLPLLLYSSTTHERSNEREERRGDERNASSSPKGSKLRRLAWEEQEKGGWFGFGELEEWGRRWWASVFEKGGVREGLEEGSKTDLDVVEETGLASGVTSSWALLCGCDVLGHDYIDLD